VLIIVNRVPASENGSNPLHRLDPIARAHKYFPSKGIKERRKRGYAPQVQWCTEPPSGVVPGCSGPSYSRDSMNRFRNEEITALVMKVPNREYNIQWLIILFNRLFRHCQHDAVHVKIYPFDFATQANPYSDRPSKAKAPSQNGNNSTEK
jgi:hypothetical protein